MITSRTLPRIRAADEGPTSDAIEREGERLSALAGTHDRGLLPSLLNHSPQGIIICDATGTLIHRNRAAERIWAGSTTTGDLDDLTKYRWFHPDGRALAPDERSIARCLTKGETTEGEETQFERFDGTRGTLFGSAAPVYDADGELSGALSVFVDITEQVTARREAERLARQLGDEQAALRRSEARFRRLAEAGGQIVWRCGLDGAPLEDSPTWRIFTGQSLEQWMGRHGWAPIHPDDAPNLTPIWEKARLDRAVFTHEFRLRRADGVYVHTSTRGVPIFDDEGVVREWIGATVDITSRTAVAEAERLRMQAENEALVERHRLASFQERFIAVLGHDLRNPLSALTMGVEILQQFDVSAQAKTLDRMASSSVRMGRMIEQLLDLTRSRLGGGLEMNRTEGDLAKVIAEVVEELKMTNPSYAVALECPPTLVGTWDMDRLAQVFSNLVGNALSHGPPDQAVRVTATKAVEGRVSIDVWNAGPPMSDELMKVLFDPFRRGDRQSRERKTLGLGLGLFISREIVTAHQGELTVTSSAEGGTRFTAVLPTSPREREAP